MDIERIVKKTISETFDHPISKITRETTADDVDGWDSLQHTILMIRLGNNVGVEMNEHVAEAGNVGDLIDRIEKLV